MESNYYGTDPGWKHLETGNLLFVDGHVKSMPMGRFIGQRAALLREVGTQGTGIWYAAW